MILQSIIPVANFAKESTPYQEKEQEENLNRVKLGTLDAKDYPKIDTKTILAINKQKRDEINGKPMQEGTQPFNAPWFPNQNEPDNERKNKLFGRIHVNFGLDGLNENGTQRPFDWEGVFGLDEEGQARHATIVFEQYDYKTGRRTGITRTMEVDKKGEFTWLDGEGEPAELPLYNRDTFEPYDYEVYLVQEKSKHVQLLTYGTLSTAGGTSFEEPDENGKIIADVTLTIGLGQVASTKFVAEWNTKVKEENRPRIGGLYNTKNKDQDGYDIEGIFVFPRTNDEVKIIRNDNWEPNDEPDEMDDDTFTSSDLRNVPEVSVDEPYTPRTDEYSVDRENKIITFKKDREYRYKYDFTYDVINGGRLIMTELIPITFSPADGEFNDNRIIKDKNKPYVVWVEYGKSVLEQRPKDVVLKDHTFIGWSPNEFNPYVLKDSSFERVENPYTYYAFLAPDVFELPQENPPGRDNFDYTMVHFDLTDKAKIRDDVDGEKKERHFGIYSKNKVTLPVVEPVGKTEQDDKGRSFTWKFKYWKEKNGNRIWHIDDKTPFVEDQFLIKDTYIEAVFEKDYTSNNEQVETYITHESKKDDAGNIINNIQLPTFDDLQKQIKIKKGNDFVALDTLTDPKEKVTVEYVKGKDASDNEYEDFDAEIYDKLQEKKNPLDNGIEAPTRTETIKAKLTYPDGEVKIVEIPIKVYKNIYEAKTLTKRPYYVPENYKPVTLDPTTNAKDPQKTYFYVNPEANVLIERENPVGVGANTFVKWANGETEYKLSGKDIQRYQFADSTTITAEYTTDVIPQEGNKKPDTVPKNFVEVKFVPTDKATDDTKAEKIFWVNPEKEVTIPVENPVGKDAYSFKEWKIGENADGAVYNPKEKKQFTEATTITATYTESDDIIPFDPKAKDPMVRRKGYVKVTFDADLGLKLTESKAYYVKKNAGITLKTIKEGTEYGYPKYEKAAGYDFDKWDKPDTTPIGTEDIVVTAKAKQVSSPSKPGDGPGYGPSYPEVVYRDRVVEKEKIVEKIVHVDDGMNKEIRYMQGFDGFFRPYDGLSRAEAAQILANALREDGYVYNPNFVLPYSDVGDMWYTEAVKVVTEAGVFKGDGNGLFKPTDKITRAEWIATLRRFQNLQEANGNTMNLKAGHWATNEVQAAYEAGWLDIYQNGIAKFASDEPITRQEVAAVSNKAFRRVLDKIYIDRNYKGLINYKDIDSSMALYEDILCASNTFLHDGKRYRAHGVLYKEIKFDHKTVFNIDTDDLKISQDKFQYILR